MKTHLTILILLFLSASVSAQDTLTIRLNPATGENANISWPDSTVNFGNVDELKADAWTCMGNPCVGRALFYFDLNAFQGFTIYHAKLNLYANITTLNGNGVPMNGINDAVLQRVTGSWNAGSVTWATQPGTTTSNEVTLAASTSSTQDYLNLDVTNLVIDLLASGNPNTGFMIRENNENPYASMIFASGNHANSSLWPELEIIYDSVNCQTMRIDISGTDANISYPDSTINYQSTTEIKADVWTCSGQPCIGRSLFTFNLSSIPVNSTVISATLDLYANPAPANGGGIAMNGVNDATLSRVTSVWSENTVTWATQPSVTSQNEVTLSASSSAFQDYLGIDVKNLVQDMVNNPLSSYGFMLKLIDEVTLYRSMIFASGDFQDSAFHPVLHLCIGSTGVDDLDLSGIFISASPNPFNQNLTFNIQNPLSESLEFILFDIVGKQIYAAAVPATAKSLSIPQNVIQNLSGGLYMSSIYSKKTGASCTIKVLKQ